MSDRFVRCPKCLGQRKFVVGCALIKPVTRPCLLCNGSGRATSAAAAYYEHHVPLTKQGVRDDHWQEFKGVPFSLAAIREGELLVQEGKP